MLLSGVTSTSHPTILSMRITDPLAHLSEVRGGDHTSSINSSPRHDTVGTVFCLPLGRVFLVCPPPEKNNSKNLGKLLSCFIARVMSRSSGIACTVLPYRA